MQQFFENLVSGISILDAIDVAIIAFVIYKVLGFIRQTRAEQLVKGLLVLVIATFISSILHLNAINWLLRGISQVALIALVVIFQPELRRGLEYIGRNHVLRSQFPGMDKDEAKTTATAIIKAVDSFSQNKIGALIVFEQEIALNDFAETGTIIDAEITTEMLGNIFYFGAPLHDGAVIVRGSRINAAACVLPLTRKKDLSADLGTRHRAGIGITEVSDALAVIVSEETGVISTAKDGQIKRFLDIRELEKIILGIYLEEAPQKRSLLGFLRRAKNVPKQ
jgi:diadenylate cyclase